MKNTEKSISKPKVIKFQRENQKEKINLKDITMTPNIS